MQERKWPKKPAPTDTLKYTAHLPEWSLISYKEAVFKGNAEAADDLCTSLPDIDRAILCSEFFYGRGVTLDVYRRFLHSTWVKSHAFLLKYIRSLKIQYGAFNGYPETESGWIQLEQSVAKEVADMFITAKFKTRNLPKELTIYRGTYGLPPQAAAQGLSWTLSKEKACWFAERGPYGLDVYARNEFNRSHGPLLVEAKISRDEVLLYTDERSEKEVVALPKEATCLGTVQASAIQVVDLSGMFGGAPLAAS